jgi:general secretion pathway protein D
MASSRLRDAARALLLCLPLFALAALAALATPDPAVAQPVRAAPGGGIMLNFQGMELQQVLEALAQAAGVNIVLSDIPQKPVTMRTPQAVTQAEIGALIRSLSEANGIAVTQERGFLRLQGRGQAGDAAADLRELYIYRLQHARAPILAATLQALFGGGPLRVPTTGAGANTLTAQLRAMEQQAAQVRPAQPGQPIIVQGQQQVRPGSGELSAPVQIVPDEVTNALLVRATPSDWQVIQQALQALDLRPLQVVIEVVIAEVRRSDELNVGASFRAGDPNPRFGERFEGGMARDAGPNDFQLRVIRQGTIDVEATLAALATTGSVRILSRPAILAQNNVEAHILVGAERPFIAISRSLPTNDAQRDQVVQYRNVGTTLRILPTINADGYVNLIVVQEVSNATNETQFGAPVISKREASTQLLARNGQTVVIGGLIDQQTDRVRSGIPFLKDIPLLGYLFSNTRESVGNSELFLFLTPYIVATDEDADRLREEIERNAELTQPFMPIRPILPPVIRPDTIPPGGVERTR